MQCHFNLLIDGAEVLTDRRGVEVPDLEQAVQEAQCAIRELRSLAEPQHQISGRIPRASRLLNRFKGSRTLNQSGKVTNPRTTLPLRYLPLSLSFTPPRAF